MARRGLYDQPTVGSQAKTFFKDERESVTERFVQDNYSDDDSFINDEEEEIEDDDDGKTSAYEEGEENTECERRKDNYEGDIDGTDEITNKEEDDESQQPKTPRKLKRRQISSDESSNESSQTRDHDGPLNNEKEKQGDVTGDKNGLPSSQEGEIQITPKRVKKNQISSDESSNDGSGSRLNDDDSQQDIKYTIDRNSPEDSKSEGRGCEDEDIYSSADSEGSIKGFIEEDDEGVRTVLPMNLSLDQSQALKTVVELMVNRAFDENFFWKDECLDNKVFKVAKQKIFSPLESLETSLRSQAWTGPFLESLKRINYSTSCLDAGSFCEACRRGERYSKYTVTLSGCKYDSSSLKPILEDDHEDEDDSYVDDNNKDRCMSTDSSRIHKHEEQYRIGKYCESRAQLYHEVLHYKWNLLDKCKTQIQKYGWTKKQIEAAVTYMLEDEEWIDFELNYWNSLVDNSQKLIQKRSRGHNPDDIDPK